MDANVQYNKIRYTVWTLTAESQEDTCNINIDEDMEVEYDENFDNKEGDFEYTDQN